MRDGLCVGVRGAECNCLQTLLSPERMVERVGEVKK